MQNFVRQVTRAATVVSALYRILVTSALGVYLIMEIKQKGRKGINPNHRD